MTTEARRRKLFIYLADAEDEKVDALYALLEGDMKGNSLELSEAHILILEQRRDDYKNGKSKPEPWQVVHHRIRNHSNCCK